MEYKLEAGEQTGKQIENDPGIGSGQVYTWRKEFAVSGERAFPGNGTPRDEELMRLFRPVVEEGTRDEWARCDGENGHEETAAAARSSTAWTVPARSLPLLRRSRPGSPHSTS